VVTAYNLTLGARAEVAPPARARAEDRIHTAKDTGLTNRPLHDSTQHQIYCAIVVLACEITTGLQLLALAGHQARRWEPEPLRLRRFSIAGQLAATIRQRTSHPTAPGSGTRATETTPSAFSHPASAITTDPADQPRIKIQSCAMKCHDQIRSVRRLAIDIFYQGANWYSWRGDRRTCYVEISGNAWSTIRRIGFPWYGERLVRVVVGNPRGPVWNGILQVLGLIIVSVVSLTLTCAAYDS